MFDFLNMKFSLKKGGADLKMKPREGGPLIKHVFKEGRVLRNNTN